MRQRDIDDVRSCILEHLDALLPKRVDFGGHVLDPIFLGNANFLAGEIAVQRRFPVRDREIERGRILGIETGHGFELDRAVANIMRHRSGLVERAGKGNRAPARAAAVGRLEAGDAGKGGGLANRAAGIGAGCCRGDSSGNDRSTATR